METAKKKSISWRSIGTCLLIIFVGMGVIEPAVMHVMAWQLATEEARDPRAAVMPKPLPITAVADLSNGEEAEAFGYSLRLPWPVSKKEVVKTMTFLYFANGASVNIVDEKDSPLGPGLLKGSTTAEAAMYKRMYGEQALSSRYAFLKAELDASPSDVSFWHSRVHNEAKTTQLIEKSVVVQKSKVVYSIAAGNMRGFQSGDPAQSNTPIWLWLFDAKDNEIWLILHPAPNVGWTQEQINAVVASIHPAN